ncbi:LOW QUALITY PROTEIN: serum amyloid P-component-like [Scleropages formosus]|uniref:LOW QUALITY PROTEIN: serum amyloid P-component-like n=1 Tax=Scleropages formosus TaxID=113540 RepID=UPI0010FA69FE|nr:LOW QUALITY PROTEIN: serum amyloid P-component-like [Scleropages formosus]
MTGQPSKFTLKSDCKILKEVAKNPQISSQALQVTLAAVGVNVHESSIRKTLRNFDLHGDLSGKVFTFPMESDQVHVKLIPNMNKSLHTATVCLRFFSDLHRDQSIFSLAMPFCFKSYSLGCTRYGLNEWASASAAWLSDTGLAQLWMNGKPGARKALDPGRTVTGRHSIILGQDLDSYGGGFDAKQSFVGLVTDVRVWDHALSPHDIYHFTQDSMFSPGNILKWSDLQYSKQGYGVVEDKQNLVSQTG